MLKCYAFVLPVLEVVKPRIRQADSGVYPRGGRLALDAWLVLSLSNMSRMARLSTDHCWKKENFCRVA
jgi:hypothetical protein